MQSDTHTMEYFSDIRKVIYEVRSRQVNMKIIILSDILQAQKDKYYVLSQLQVAATNFYMCAFVWD